MSDKQAAGTLNGSDLGRVVEIRCGDGIVRGVLTGVAHETLTSTLSVTPGAVSVKITLRVGSQDVSLNARPMFPVVMNPEARG